MTVLETVVGVEAGEPAEAADRPSASVVEALTTQDEAGNAVTVLKWRCGAAAGRLCVQAVKCSCWCCLSSSIVLSPMPCRPPVKPPMKMGSPSQLTQGMCCLPADSLRVRRLGWGCKRTAAYSHAEYSSLLAPALICRTAAGEGSEDPLSLPPHGTEVLTAWKDSSSYSSMVQRISCSLSCGVQVFKQSLAGQPSLGAVRCRCSLVACQGLLLRHS